MTEETTSEQSTESAPSSDVSSDERSIGVAAHLVGPLGFGLNPTMMWVGPLLVWLLCTRNDAAYGKGQAREALNLQIHFSGLFLLVHFIQVLPFIKDAPTLWLWVGIVMLGANIVFSVLAAVGAMAGARFSHKAYTIPFLK